MRHREAAIRPDRRPLTNHGHSELKITSHTQLDGDRMRPSLPALSSSDLDDKFAVHTAILKGGVCAGDVFQVVGVVDDGED